MFRAILDTGGAVSVLALRIPLPLVGDGVVDLHRRTLLLADALVEKVPARLRRETKCAISSSIVPSRSHAVIIIGLRAVITFPQCGSVRLGC